VELAQPHVVVRTCGPGIGRDLVAALGVHPVAVSEVRDRPEARRVAAGPAARLVVVVGAADADGRIAEVREDFPGVPVLLVGAAAPPADVPGVDVIPADASLDDVCWRVIEAISRAVGRSGTLGHPIDPFIVDLDAAGTVGPTCDTLGHWLLGARRLRPGASLLEIVAPADGESFRRSLEHTAGGDARFLTVRVLDAHGSPHAVHVGLRATGGGRISAILQPLVCAASTSTGQLDIRDPITGLVTRWEMFRRLEALAPGPAGSVPAAMLLLKLDNLEGVADTLGSEQTDTVLVRVAEAVTDAFPWPALASRVLGDAFLVHVPEPFDAAQIEARVRQLIGLVNGIVLPLPGSVSRLRASAGVAHENFRDIDLAVRLAEAAVSEAHAVGGNRMVVAGSAAVTPCQAGELLDAMERGSWEVWLQPVVGAADGRPEFHEALARFDVGRRLISRPEFFMAGLADGLLERFDRLMLARCLDLVATHPGARLSINVTAESFVAETFPDAWIAAVREVPAAVGNLILEIAPRCLMFEAAGVRARLAAREAAGIPVALDDFGSGIGCLAHLTQFPLDSVKLDGLVTGYVDDDPLQREFVRTVVTVCRARGIPTVAEYTRSPEQRARLVADGVDLLQGELIGMPRPAEEVFGASDALGNDAGEPARPAVPGPTGGLAEAAAGP
jgi:diguanylate cyclase (GGDEF)-like protein